MVTQRLPAAACLLAFALLPAVRALANADRTYAVSGSDSFSVGAGEISSETRYRGTQTLSLRRRGSRTRLVARVTYVRSDQGVSSPATAEYVADLDPDGAVADSADRDPDYLTVLNQPFAAVLDRPTLEDLQHLRGRVSFDFRSPFTDSSLHGFLEPVPAGPIGATPAIGVRFEAGGPMRGAVPDRPGLVLDGRIAMRGTAYYDARGALLLALAATVTISGNLSNRSGRDPVTIVYRRQMRAAR
jgi:hypothetical protein